MLLSKTFFVRLFLITFGEIKALRHAVMLARIRLSVIRVAAFGKLRKPIFNKKIRYKSIKLTALLRIYTIALWFPECVMRCI